MIAAVLAIAAAGVGDDVTAPPSALAGAPSVVDLRVTEDAEEPAPFDAGAGVAWVFERIGQGVGDLDPLAADARVARADLRRPIGFGSVYRVVGGGASRLARRDNGVTAVFPRSEYERIEGAPDVSARLVARVPADTVFVIGRPPARTSRWLGLGGDERPAPHASARPIRASAVSAGPARSAPREVAVRSPETRSADEASSDESPAGDLFVDEGYRARRVGALLERAAAGEPATDASGRGGRPAPDEDEARD